MRTNDQTSRQNMSEELSEAEVVERMKAILLAMPALRREIFLSARADHLTHVEIAKLYGLSVRQVERHMLKSFQQLLAVRDPLPETWWQRVLRWTGR